MATGWDTLQQLHAADQQGQLSEQGKATLGQLRDAFQAGQLSGVPPNATLPDAGTSTTITTTSPAPLLTRVKEKAKEYAPLIGQVGGGLAAGPLGGIAGGLAGSAIQRGGVPTLGDVGTTLVGEAIPFAPGVAKGAIGRVLARGTEAASQAAERFGVPLGAGELSKSPVIRSWFEHLARSPFASRTMTRAGTAQSEAITSAVGKIIEERFGGALPVAQFGARARRSILATAKLLAPARGEAMMATAKKLAGDTLQSARLAEAVAKDPETLAFVMNRVGEAGINDLRQAWWTTVLNNATGTAGLRKGLVNPKEIVKAWNGLGEAGQTALFGQRRAFLQQFVGVLEQAKAAEIAGAKTHFPNYLRWTLVGALGGIGYGHVGTRLAEAAAAEAAAPWVAAQVLTNGPPSAFGKLLSAVGPTASRGAAQTLLSSPPVPPPLALPPPAPAMTPLAMGAPPLSQHPGLDTPEGIMAAIQNTRLGPGWRPGRPPAIQ